MAGELAEVASREVETAGVLLARTVTAENGDLRLLARDIHWVTDEAYLRREASSLVIESFGYVPALSAAESTGTVPIWLHTHPGKSSTPRPSLHDEIVDKELSDLFRLRSGSDLYGSAIFSQSNGRVLFTGHVESSDQRRAIDRLWMVGRWLALEKNWLHESKEFSRSFERNIRAFGGAIQEILSGLRVGIVGCGGTGSAVAEQLVRLGVRQFVLVDPDSLSESNLTRVYGAYALDIGRFKVSIAAEHLRRVAPDVDVLAVSSLVTAESTAKKLLSTDIIFGCTDDNAGRLVLSRMASYLLTPVIDCGVVLTSSENGRLEGIYGRVTVLVPGAACLVCRDRIDLRRAASEALSEDERSRLVHEGYAPALVGVEPAVVVYTTQVAAAAVGELLERLIHYGPQPVPSELLLRVHERELSTNDQEPGVGHYCHPNSRKLGLGLTEPFLEQVWKA